MSRARAAGVALTAGLLVGTACAADDGATGTTSAPTSALASTSTSTTALAADSLGCAADPATLGAPSSHERVDLEVDGAPRWYARWVPPDYDGEAVPLVVELHGYLSGSAGMTTMSEMGAVADDEGFVVVTPQGSGALPYWNAVPHDDLPDDLGFVEAVLDDVADDVCIDPDRIYVDGFSNGAFMASLVACRLADRVAAVAPVAGLLDPAGCDPARPVPILAMHGTADEFVSYSGPPNPALDGLAWDAESLRAFEDLPFGDVRDAAAAWAARNGCGGAPAPASSSDHITSVTYEGCEQGATVVLATLDGAGHTWPGSAFAAASAGVLGPSTDEIDASRAIWAFFADHPMG